MALDAICLQAVVREIAPQVEGLKIEKIQQPARDQVILLLRGSRRLLLCASANQPRMNLTEVLRDNPSQPPMFCMLLRKHLSGGRILSVRQEPMERVVTLEIEAMNELGEMGQFSLVLEAMNRHSNLILCDGEGRILDCMRRVDFEMSQQRQVLPGLFYHLPPRQEKQPPLDMEEQEFRMLLQCAAPEAQADKWLLDTFTAISPLWARELAYRAGGSTDCLLETAAERLWEEFSAWQALARRGDFQPTVIERGGKPMDFTFAPVRQYETACGVRRAESFSGLLDQSFLGETAESGQDGRNYTEYLSCMMFFMDRGVRNFRMMDLIQWNIRMGQADFSVASCAYQIEIEAEVMQKHMFFQKEEYRGTVHAAGSY